ncbi:hypothetical protein [Tsukamurella soli]|uniref:hypothetical protein n=1 Tax=Tsukamurella soli TaxID=644556 RepID=UPI00362051C2
MPGLLPTDSSWYNQANVLDPADLSTTLGDVANLLDVTGTDVSNIPGLPSNAVSSTLGTGLGDSLSTVGGALGDVADVLDVLSPVTGALSDLNTAIEPLNDVVSDVNSLLATLPGGQGLELGTISVPTLSSLLSALGVVATNTQYGNDFDWGLLGISGNTTVNNLFVQIPSISLSGLVGTAVDQVDASLSSISGNNVVLGAVNTVLSGSGLSLSDISGDVGDVLDDAGLDATTPSITAWDPTATGTYTLPFNGAIGFLDTMPVLDVGPLDTDLVGVPALSTSDTVVAIPITAYGITFPGNLFSYGTLSTPGLVLPTATGVSMVGGTSLSNFAIADLGFNDLTVTTGQSSYYGTNGVYSNSGVSAATLSVAGLTIPIEYSMGSYYYGTTGVGFTLPSIDGVSLLPPIDIGTVPDQTSDDGLITASVINTLVSTAGVTSTPVTDVTGLLGLDSGIQTVASALGSVYTPIASTVGGPITSYLNDNVGTWANNLASEANSLSGSLATQTGDAATSLGVTPNSTAPAATPAVVPAATTTTSLLATNKVTTPSTTTDTTNGTADTTSSTTSSTTTSSTTSGTTSSSTTGGKGVGGAVHSVASAVHNAISGMTHGGSAGSSSSGGSSGGSSHGSSSGKTG